MVAVIPGPWSESVHGVGPPPDVWREATRTIIWLRGAHDLSTATHLTDAVGKARAIGLGDVVVDLSNVEFMDGSIVGVLLRARYDLARLSRRLTVRSPSSTARRVLALCKLSDIIETDHATLQAPGVGPQVVRGGFRQAARLRATRPSPPARPPGHSAALPANGVRAAGEGPVR